MVPPLNFNKNTASAKIQKIFLKNNLTLSHILAMFIAIKTGLTDVQTYNVCGKGLILLEKENT